MVKPALTLNDLKEHAEEHLRRLRETGEPQPLDLNGKGEVLLIDRAAFFRLLELVDRQQVNNAIRQGMEAKTQGRFRPAGEFFQELASRHGITLNEPAE